MCSEEKRREQAIELAEQAGEQAYEDACLETMDEAKDRARAEVEQMSKGMDPEDVDEAFEEAVNAHMEDAEDFLTAVYQEASEEALESGTA
jgi:N-methylhydantoinase B/oxoprolinase/acetone carboxylase alpha subunit